jgi:hypothetical protein
MENKSDTKRSRSPSKEGIPSPSDTKTPPSMSSRSPPPLGSPLEISSCRPCSPVFEQGALGRLQWWNFLHLLMRKVSSLMSREIRSLLEDFLVTSTTTSLGRPATVRSSSSVTSMKKKRRCTRRRLPTPKIRLLLLQSILPQSPPLTLMMHLQG